MAVQLTPLVFIQLLDAEGLNLAGGLIHTYVSGTTTPQATWTDGTETTEAENPIELDSSGRVPGIWLTVDQAYTLYVTDSDGANGRTIDDVIISTPSEEIAPTAVDIYFVCADPDPPTTLQWLSGAEIRRPITFPIDLENSGVSIVTAPTAPVILTCRLNSTTASDGEAVATCTIQTDKSYAFETTDNVEFDVDIDDHLDWYAPAGVDLTIQGFRLTMVGRVTGTAPGDLITQSALDEAVADGIAAALPAGTITMWGGTVAPTGWLECNGAAVSRATYSALFTKIGITWGEGNTTTTFNVPDMRGVFPRGWDHGRGVDTGRALEATNQGHAFQGHYHEPLGATSEFVGVNGAGDVAHADGSTFIRDASTGAPIEGDNGAVQIADETRPINLALMFIIKAS